MQGPRRHFEIGGAKKFLVVLVLIKKLEFLGRNWYLFSKSKNVGGAIAPPAPLPTRALLFDGHQFFVNLLQRIGLTARSIDAGRCGPCCCQHQFEQLNGGISDFNFNKISLENLHLIKNFFW